MTHLEQYLQAMRERRNVAVDETSYYDALSNLCNETGATLKPKVRYVITPKAQGAGLPDGGLYTAQQLRRGAETTIATTPPERGCVEVKGLKADVEKIAASEQVEKYLKRYGQVLVTNYRDFLLVSRDEAGRRQNLERYTLAASEQEFWSLAATAAKEHGARFEEYLKRVMLHAAPLASPEDVARFLASYARDARARVEQKTDLPALQGLREALEQALGLKFEGERGEHFFRSTLVQTLFYGIFSAWVLWAQEQARNDARDRFDWRLAGWFLRVPMIKALFHQLLDESKLKPLGLPEILNWTGATLNRIENPTAFIEQFTEGHAVQYFYEPFLQEFDPELRKQLGVWYTPQEIVRYMVERVDRVLRDELGVAEGLAGEEVYVLDPCCGTGTYLVEVLRRIERTLEEQGHGANVGGHLRKAATTRVFGFEILPAPFVVAHLQLGLLLQTMGAALEEGKDERVGVFLTNSLTGWEPPKGAKARLLFPELEEERDRAEEVKQKRPILVVMGNPPYNGFAGVAVDEERVLTNAYRTTINAPPPQGQGLNDLYVRFYRAAERRIVETGKGVVSFISNYSWLDGLSFTGMRERYLEVFDRIWIDNLNGDSRKTGKLTPEGEPDPSVFSTEYNREGIQVGTAIALLMRRERHERADAVSFRDFWGKNKTDELLQSMNASEEGTHPYIRIVPETSIGLPLMPLHFESGYTNWALLTELFSVSFPGIQPSRDDVVVDISRKMLVERMEAYFDKTISQEDLQRIAPSAVKNGAGFDAKATRELLQKRGFLPQYIVRYQYRPFDSRWLYWEPETKLLDRKREDYFPHVSKDNFWLSAVQQNRKSFDPPFVTKQHASRHIVERGANMFPLLLNSAARVNLFDTEQADEMRPNLSDRALAYLESVGATDEYANLFFHTVATLHAPAYSTENAGALRQDFPRVPLPASADALKRSAALGREVADLLAYDPGDPSASPSPLKGIVATPLRAEMRAIAVPARTGGGQFSADDYALTAHWGYGGQNGVTMPGRGKAIERDYTPQERAAIEQGAAPLGLSTGEAFARLGATTFDIYLNEAAYWRNIPARVWDYYIGGYQVIKKWLSYREHDLLKRNLSTDELSEVAAMARRLAALRLLEPALDENYQACKADTYAWKVPAQST